MEVVRAIHSKSDAKMVVALRAVHDRVSELHSAIARTSPANAVEHRAKPLVLTALAHSADGYGELHAAFASAATDPQGHHVISRLRHEREAERLLRIAAGTGHHARQLLQCDDFCGVLK
jgi:hypothetical protein